MKFSVKVVKDPSKVNLNKLTNWMYNWWGKENGNSKQWVKHFMFYSFNTDRLPLTIVAFAENGEEAAVCHLTMHDLEVRPDIYPYVANLFVSPKYRGNGLVKQLLKVALREAKKMGFKEVFIYTKHENLYDKYGWQFLGLIETFKNPRMQRLYKYTIK